SRVIVGGRADPAEAEHEIARGERPPEDRGNPIGDVAEVLAPGKLHAAGGEDLDQLREVLVRALADDDLVADDDRAHPHTRTALPSMGSPRASSRRARQEWVKNTPPD